LIRKFPRCPVLASLTAFMVFRHIDPQIKERILWLHHHAALDDVTLSDLFDVSERSIQRWASNLKQFDDITPPANPIQGRPRILSGDQIDGLLSELTDFPELTLSEMKDWVLITHDLEISKAALHQLLRDVAWSRKLLRKAASERNEVDRTAFMDFIKANILASMVVSVDETSKDNRTIFRHYGWAPQGHRAVAEVDFIRGDRFSIVAALSIEGYIATRVVPGSVNTDEFFDFIVHDVVSYL
jgi:transposase